MARILFLHGVKLEPLSTVDNGKFVRFVLRKTPSHVRSSKSKRHDGQRRINEAGKCIRENTALRTILRGGVRFQACHAAV